MFSYYLRLALLALRKTPLITALMVGAIGLGVGVSMTMLSLHYLMSGDPIPGKSDKLYAVQVDSWDGERPYEEDEPEQPPPSLTYKDTVGLLASDVPTRQVAMYQSGFMVDPADPEITPFLTQARGTTADFFAMFDVPFLFGGAWDTSADTNAEPVVVISRETNDRLFGGVDSVGQQIKFGTDYYRVVGVRDDWEPQPKYYDIENGAFDHSEDVYVPFALFEAREIVRNGNTRCWKDELIDSYQALLQSECIWSSVWVELDTPQQKAEYMAWLDGYVEQQKKLGRHDRPINNQLTNVTDWLKLREVVPDETKVLLSLSFMFLVVCLFNMIGLLLARLISKAPIVGLRRALGASKAQIFKQHLIEVALVGLAGGTLGLLLSWLGLQGVAKLYQEFDVFAYLNLPLIGIGLGVAVLASLTAGLYPTWRICQISPANYLKTQ